MSVRGTRLVLSILLLVALAAALFACSPTPAAPDEGEGNTEKITVGLSFSDFATERWKNEEVLMTQLLEEKGYEVISQEANHDVKMQNDQIDNMVSQGVDAIIIVAEDGDAAATAASKAAAEGVIVLAYDRLIKSPDIAAYVSFNNVEVGRQQALGVMSALDMDNWDVDANGPARIVMLGGSPTDNNAILFRQGQMEIVQPYVDAGTVEIVADQWVDNWDPANALKIMENILTAQNNDIDGVVASNDGTALGALQALSGQKLAGVVPISGQDATADGCNSIVKGELTVSILKDIRDLSPLAVDLIDELIKGQEADLEMYTLAELTNDESLAGEVPCNFLPVYQVNEENVHELVVESGFQTYEDVYRDIPEDQRPADPTGDSPPVGEEDVEEPMIGMKVGLSFSDFATERWKNEEVLMTQLLEEKGYEVISQEANHDVKMQNDQIDNMVSQGVDAIIIVAEDGDAAATAASKAAAEGVIVLAYDRLIKSPDIAAYVSFNNVEVGRQQALGVMSALDMDNWDVDANGPARIVMLGGSPTDNNAILFRQGQMEIVQPYVDAGTVEIVADQWVDNWDPANALKIMENILTAQNNDIDGVVASNDGTALGALQALSGQKLAGVVPISGQDATADGCNSIVKGELTVSILKDIRDLSPLAVDLIDELIKGQEADLEMYTLAELTNDESLAGEVPCNFLPVYQVNEENVHELVVESGFQTYEDVYRDIPESERPPEP
ncbi:MAG: substrate-binding domain-containing protein [Anaerolineales bacterium]